jgi:hypothetical protein
MALYDNNLDIVSGGDDVTRAIAAVNLAQDWFEVTAASIPEVYQQAGSISTVANQENSTWPATFLRMDSLWRLDSNSVPIVELDSIDLVGGHQPPYPWPIGPILAGQSATGAPTEFYATGPGASIYWSPKPDAIYNMRFYGFIQQNDYTAAGDTFLYGDSVALALAPLAAKVLRMGLDRDLTAVPLEAEAAFKAVLKQQSNALRSGPRSKVYEDYHEE